MSRILEFSELLITKLGHDLAKNIDPFSQTAYAEMMAKLHYYCYAYGVVSGESEADLAVIKKLVEPYFVNSRIKVIWQQDQYSDFSALTPVMSKLLLNMLLAVANSMDEGEVQISLTKNGTLLKVNGHCAQPIKASPEMQAILFNHDNIDFEEVNIQTHLLAKLASSLGIQLGGSMGAKNCTLVAEIVPAVD